MKVTAAAANLLALTALSSAAPATRRDRRQAPSGLDVISSVNHQGLSEFVEHPKISQTPKHQNLRSRQTNITTNWVELFPIILNRLT
jgi:hypothetical protein